jgi:UDP-N-acetylmuramoyl-tripeptide--D-alanyl-D-alanine ligase
MRQMTLSQIAHILQIKNIAALSFTPSGFCTDTRILKSSELFIALKGERIDGHDCLKDASKKGACAAIVSKNYQGPTFDLILLRVDDPLQALQELARFALKSRPVRIVAITGSLGKTTTKEFLKVLLSKKYRVAASPGNSNSQVGLPLALLNHTDGSEEILVLEMGMTHPGNISGLISIVHPELAIITAAALVHACNFDSIDAIARAKAEILSHPETGHAIIHRDIANYNEIAEIGNSRKISFSMSHPQADYQMELKKDVLFLTEYGEVTCLGKLSIPGKHNAHNLLAAIAGARYFNVSLEEIKSALPELNLPERRLQQVIHKGIVFINDSYNAAELSVKAALESLPLPENKGRRIAVLGSMMELGKFSNECHTKVAEHALNLVDSILCLGEECRPIFDLWHKKGRPVAIFLDRAALINHLRDVVKVDDVVLLKGSRSKELWKVIEEL